MVCNSGARINSRTCNEMVVFVSFSRVVGVANKGYKF